MEAPRHELTALLISPARELAEAFARSHGAARCFQVLADLRAYPAPAVLEMRLRQVRPEVVLLDVETDFERAGDLIRSVAASAAGALVVGLHSRSDQEAILKSLRLGASEFLYAPFDPEVQRQAAGRLRRLLGPDTATERKTGRVVLFASAKPGSGASTLASQAAFALRKLTADGVLVADLDLMSATTTFALGGRPQGSLFRMLASGEDWTDLVAPSPSAGVDLLAADGMPEPEAVDPARLHEFLERARQLYGWTILDLPSVFHRLTLMAASEADSVFLVATPDLPSLHLARRAVQLLGELGFERDRFQVVLNRRDGGGGLGEDDVRRLCGCAIEASFPEDPAAVGRALALGEAVEASTGLGRTVSGFAGRLAGIETAPGRAAGMVMNTRPAYSAG
jgi:pilus assembly protein CpaE